jgi:hypothetical protein
VNIADDSARARLLVRLAMAGAGIMLAHQVAGKAARDGLFLSQFAPTDLPKIVSAAAMFALLSGYLFSRLLERTGPRRLMPAAFGVSGVFQLCEYGAYELWPGITAVVVYLHIVGVGAILLSGYWSLISELFDPREARLHFGKIAAAGTAGGIGGGLLAERVVSFFSAAAVLLLLAVLHFACASVVARFHPAGARPRRAPARPLRSVGELFRGSSYLWNLAALVLLGTASAAILDYLFKSNATAVFGKGPGLVRFFAVFYTASQILTFLVQSLLSTLSLEKLGLAKTVASLPLATGAGSLTALLIPVFPTIASVRSLELILRGSLFRSGYELFFTPVPAADKRSVKTIIDVGCDRMGDAAGAALIQLAIFLGPAIARAEILTIAMVLSGVCVWIAFRLDRAYLAVLERGLVTRAAELDLEDIQDPGTLSVVMRSIPQLRVPAVRTAPVAAEQIRVLPADPTLRVLAELRSGDLTRVRAALAEPAQSDAAVVPQLIRLLAWDEAADGARHALGQYGCSIAGQLVDALLNPSEEFTVRRRLPRLLARCGTQRAVEGLLEGLNDGRFEVRFQCARALDYLAQRNPNLRYPADVVYSAVEREIALGRSVWESHRLLDRREGRDSGDGYLFLDDVLRERCNHMLEHLFSLLAVVLPRDPLKVAFRALHTEDKLLRGLAAEYLDSVLPQAIREKLWTVIEAAPAGQPQPAEEVARRLLRSSESIAFQLKKRDGGDLFPNAPQSTATPE